MKSQWNRNFKWIEVQSLVVINYIHKECFLVGKMLCAQGDFQGALQMMKMAVNTELKPGVDSFKDSSRAVMRVSGVSRALRGGARKRGTS